ncbi:MAG: PPOX class F420-dependent oxidoreductase, partial [Dehalococcoidia bacterium]
CHYLREFPVPALSNKQMSMNSMELAEFLERGRVGVVATLRRDGYPQVSPVWYRYDGKSIIIWAEKDRVWVRNAKRNSRVAFSVQDQEPPFGAVVVRGRAEVTDRLDETGLDEAKKISRRYMGEDKVDGYVEGFWPQLHTFVKITPEAVKSWGRGY